MFGCYHDEIFYIATVDKNEPKVRHFGFVMEYDGKMCFGTSNAKPFFKQLSENQNIEICGTNKEMRWVRIRGKAAFCTTREAKEKSLDIMPTLKSMYSADDPVFEIFYIKNAIAEFYSMNGDRKTVVM